MRAQAVLKVNGNRGVSLRNSNACLSLCRCAENVDPTVGANCVRPQKRNRFGSICENKNAIYCVFIRANTVYSVVR